MDALFAYGTLLCKEILEEVTGYLPGGVTAKLEDYRRFSLKGATYPGMARCSGHEVEGVVFFDITPEAWGRLDEFEGELYARERVVALTPGGREVEAHAYVLKEQYQHLAEERDWDIGVFIKRGGKI